jgi:hypothetical protein
MTDQVKSSDSTRYRIRLKGRLDSKWSEWLYPMAISIEGDETVLAGEVSDQAALHGLLIRIRDLNLKLLCLESTGREERNEE